MEIISTPYALLAVQSSLLDVVTKELRAVIIDIHKTKKFYIFYIRFYYDGEISEELIDLWECAITEASADLGVDCRTDDEIERVNYPEKIPCYGHYAYLRREEDQNENDPKLNRAILEYSNPEKLIKDFSGKGRLIGDIPSGSIGCREIMDFQEFIGYVINRENGDKIKTSVGIIHYTEDGINVIPAYHGKVTELKDKYVIAYALLAMQNALLGRVTPELRSVIVDFCEETNLLYARIYYDGKVSEEVLNLWEGAITEVCADLGIFCIFDVKIERVDYPEKMPFRGRYAYLRTEARID